MKWKPEQVTEWKLLVNNDLLFSHNALCIFACLSFRRRYTIFLVSCSKNMHARTHTHMYVCTHACTHAHTYTSKNTHGGVKLLPSPSCITTHTHTHTKEGEATGLPPLLNCRSQLLGSHSMPILCWVSRDYNMEGGKSKLSQAILECESKSS